MPIIWPHVNNESISNTLTRSPTTTTTKINISSPQRQHEHKTTKLTLLILCSILTILLSTLTITSSSTFLSLQPINGHELQFYGHLSCTSAGELDCTNTLGFVHVVQYANKPGSIIYSTLNVTMFDAYDDAIPYSRYQFNQLTDNSAGRQKDSIHGQFPVDITPPKTPRHYPIGGLHGDISLVMPKDSSLPLPYTIDYDNDPTQRTAPLLNSSRIEVTFGDTSIVYNELYRNLHDSTSLIHSSHTNVPWIFNMTADRVSYVEETGLMVGLPVFTISIPVKEQKVKEGDLENDDGNNNNNNNNNIDNEKPTFDFQLLDIIDNSQDNNNLDATSSSVKSGQSDQNFTKNVQKGSILSDVIPKATIDAFIINLTGPTQFTLNHTTRTSVPCTISTWYNDTAKNKSIIESSYNWLGTVQLPQVWVPDVNIDVITVQEQNKDTHQLDGLDYYEVDGSDDQDENDQNDQNLIKSTPRFSVNPTDDPDPVTPAAIYTGLKLEPYSNGDLVQISGLTTHLTLDCTSLGSLRISSLFKYHSPSARLPESFIPDVEAIPTYSSIVFNLTAVENAALDDNITKQASTLPVMMGLHNQNPFYMIPLSEYSYKQGSWFNTAIIIIVMMSFTLLFAVLIITFLRASYGTCYNIILPQDLVRKYCCGSRDMSNNDENSGVVGPEGYYDNMNNAANFDMATSRNTDLDYLMTSNESNIDGVSGNTFSPTKSSNHLNTDKFQPLANSSSHYNTSQQISQGYVMRTNTTFNNNNGNNPSNTGGFGSYGSFQGGRSYNQPSLPHHSNVPRK